MRRRMIVGLMAVLAAGALVIGATAATAGASVAQGKKAPVCKGKTKKKAVKQIKDAYDHFLNGADYPDAVNDKEPYIQYLSGSDVSPQLQADFEASAAALAEASATTTVKVNKVKCTGKKTADVDYDLVISGEVTPGIVPPGDAVLVDNTWKVSGLTLCNTQAAGDPTVLDAGPCADILAGNDPADLTSS